MRARELIVALLAAAGLLLLCLRVGAPRGDFANYYVAAALWWELPAAELVRLYDYRWFTGQAARLGFGDRLVGFPVLTPPSVLLAVPLLPLGPARAALAWWAAQAAMVVGLAACLARTVRRPLWAGALLLLALWPALGAHLYQGQMHLPAVLALAGGGLAWSRGREPLAGALWGLAVGLKVHAWPLLLLLAVGRRWGALGAAAGTLAAGGALSVALAGWPLHAAWLADIAPAAASGWFIDPWHLGTHSLGSTCRDLLHPMPGRNLAWQDAPRLAAAIPAAVMAAMVGLSVLGAPSARRRGAAAVAALVSGPLLASYHLTLLLPAAAWAADAAWRDGARLRAVGIVALAAAATRASVPAFADVTSPEWFLLGLPRFWLLLGMWALMLPAPGRRLRWGLLAVAALSVLSALRAAPPPRAEVTAEAHPLLAEGVPLISADLTLDADGTLRWDGLVPGEGWVGLALTADEGEVRIAAADPDAHTWATASGWSVSPTEPPLAGGPRPGPGGGTVESVDGDILWRSPSGETRWLTRHPARDTEPVWDARRGRVWFLSDRAAGVRAMRLWWVETGAAGP